MRLLQKTEHSLGSREKENQVELEKVLKETKLENFPKLAKDINLRVQEIEQILSKINSKKFMPRNIIVNLWELKKKKKFVSRQRETTLYL